MQPLRGEVWNVRFDPTVGAEIQKVRPAIVVNAAGMGRLPLRLVVPVTDWKPHYRPVPWLVHLVPSRANGLWKESAADAFQVKSVSELRFVARLGAVSGAKLGEIVAAIALCIGYP